jgi:NTE family protein
MSGSATMPPDGRTRSRVGVALGSGSARGWAHIGVLQALRRAGVEPGVVCGTSIGALIGGAYALGDLDSLGDWVRGLTRRDVVRLLDVRLTGGGLIQGEHLMRFFRGRSYDRPIEDLPKAFSAVATDLGSGREVWIRRGPLIDAVRASFALPGLFAPVRRDGRWLVDGGLVNPVPISVCRALGAEVVIAVNLNGDRVGRHTRCADDAGKPRVSHDPGVDAIEEGLLVQLAAQFADTLRAGTTALIGPYGAAGTPTPGLFDVLSGSLNIMQDRITRSRMAGDPPDLVISPRLGHLGLMEFDRADEAIEAGTRAVEQSMPAIRERCIG